MTPWTDAAPPGPQPSGPAPDHLPRHAPAAEHAALVQDPARFDLLRRKEDLLAEGVATVFGISQGEAEPLAFYFHPGRFTPAQARDWLRERRIGFIRFTEAAEAGDGPHPQPA